MLPTPAIFLADVHWQRKIGARLQQENGKAALPRRSTKASPIRWLLEPPFFFLRKELAHGAQGLLRKARPVQCSWKFFRFGAHFNKSPQLLF